MSVSGIDGGNSYWPTSGSSGSDGADGADGAGSGTTDLEAGGALDSSKWGDFGTDTSYVQAGAGLESGLTLAQSGDTFPDLASDSKSLSNTDKHERDGSPPEGAADGVISTVKEGAHYAHKVLDKIVDSVKDGARDAASAIEEDAGGVVERVEQGTTAATSATTEVTGEGSSMLENVETGLAGAGGILGGLEVGEGLAANKEDMARISKEGLTTDNALDLVQDDGKVVGGTIATMGSVAKLASGVGGELESTLSDVASYLPGGMRLLGGINVLEQGREAVNSAENGDMADTVDHTFNAIGSAVMTKGGGYGLVAGLGLMGLGKLDKYAIKGEEKAIKDAGPDAAQEVDALYRYSGG